MQSVQFGNVMFVLYLFLLQLLLEEDFSVWRLKSALCILTPARRVNFCPISNRPGPSYSRGAKLHPFATSGHQPKIILGLVWQCRSFAPHVLTVTIQVYKNIKDGWDAFHNSHSWSSIWKNVKYLDTNILLKIINHHQTSGNIYNKNLKQ